MAQSEERPSKIRKLGSGLEDDQVSEFASSADKGSLKRGKDDGETSNENDPAEVLPRAAKADETASLTFNGNDDLNETQPSQPLSKNQLKKLRNKQRWEEGREFRKVKRKEKDKEKKVRKAEARAIVDPQSEQDVLPTPDAPKRSPQRPVQLPITFILDCDFDDLMTEAEMISLGSQLTRCYSDNRGAPYRAHLVVSSFGGNLKHRFQTVLANNHLGWKGVNFKAEDFVAAAPQANAVMRAPHGGQLVGAFRSGIEAGLLSSDPPSQSIGEAQSSTIISSDSPLASETAIEIPSSEAKLPAANSTIIAPTDQTYSPNSASATELSAGVLKDAPVEETAVQGNGKASRPSQEPCVVYLTSDSPHTLDFLSPYTTYIIGGLVDKNRHKGICYKRAMAREVPTAKLPIAEYMTMQSRSVLATNHVVEIMLRWLEHGDWAKAFLQVIPKRKEAKLKFRQVSGGDLQDTYGDRGINVSAVFERDGGQG